MPTYIFIAILALAVIAMFATIIKKKLPGATLSPLTGIAFALVVAGVVFGQDHTVGYGLIGAGVGLSIFELIRDIYHT